MVRNYNRGIWKSGANLCCDLLIFDPKPITLLYPKKAQIEQKVIIVFIESRKEIGLWSWIIWIAVGYFWFRLSSGGKLGSRLDQKLKLCVHHLSLWKLEFSKIQEIVFVQLWGLLVVRMTAQFNVVYWSYCPKTHQNGHNWVLDQTNIVLLLGKAKTNKYTETETWHTGRVEEWSYYRLCDNFW